MGLGQCQAQGPALRRGFVAVVSIISSLNLGFWECREHIGGRILAYGHLPSPGGDLTGHCLPSQVPTWLPPPGSALLLHHFLPVVVTTHVHGWERPSGGLGMGGWRVRLMLCSISVYNQVVPFICSW